MEWHEAGEGLDQGEDGGGLVGLDEEGGAGGHLLPLDLAEGLQGGVDELGHDLVLLKPGRDGNLLHVDGVRAHEEDHGECGDPDVPVLYGVVDKGGVDGLV